MSSEFSRRLNRRLLRAFIVQIGLISATAVVGVYLAEFAIRELLIVSALEREANYFWARQNIDPETKAPNTHALIGYVFDVARPEAYPEEFQRLQTGLHDLETPVGQSVVHVSEANGRRLFLVFDADNVRQLATYFGLVPLALLLVVLYSSAWLAYRIAGRAVSPLIKLARDVRELDLESPEQVTLGNRDELQGADDEVLILSHALEQLVERVNKFVERERILTRETSHELRSPLTVIRIASDMLSKRDDMSGQARATVDKIQRAAKDMEELTEAFLLLAREDTSSMLTEAVDINSVVRAEFARCELVYADKELDLGYAETSQLTMTCSPKVLAIVIGNLLRNACAYTDDGYVHVVVAATGVRISDSGVGISNDELKAVFSPYYRAPNARESGHGIGLSLVKRMTDRFGWPIDITSRPGHGTVVIVHFPDARISAPRDVPAPERSAG
ncbi:MAG: sensor histidine kinase [Gammaproteobacteria bacterium]|jgi:signal transduction histidine kinase